MSRVGMIVICTAVCALIASSAIVMVMMFHGEDAVLSDKHRAAREAFFGSDAANQPIPKGQEMRPRW